MNSSMAKCQPLVGKSDVVAKERLTTLQRRRTRGNGQANPPMIAYVPLGQSRGRAVTGMRFWLLLAALWVTLTGTFLVWFTLINAPGGRYAFGGVLLDRNLASPYLLVIAVTLTIAASIIVTRRRRSLRQTPTTTSGN
jgi:hypothetical protein